MTSHAKIALNPLPWVLTERGFELSVPESRSQVNAQIHPPSTGEQSEGHHPQTRFAKVYSALARLEDD